MLIGEDKRKVDNIVKPLLKQFEELYSAPLQSIAEKTPDGLYRKVCMHALSLCMYVCTYVYHSLYLCVA